MVSSIVNATLAAVDVEIFDEAEADDVAVKIGIVDHLERVEHARLFEQP